jgi:hypothetical protein
MYESRIPVRSSDRLPNITLQQSASSRCSPFDAVKQSAGPHALPAGAPCDRRAHTRERHHVRIDVTILCSFK